MFPRRNGGEYRPEDKSSQNPTSVVRGITHVDSKNEGMAAPDLFPGDLAMSPGCRVQIRTERNHSFVEGMNGFARDSRENGTDRQIRFPYDQRGSQGAGG